MDWDYKMNDGDVNEKSFEVLPNGTEAKVTILSYERRRNETNACPQLSLKLRAEAKGQTCTFFENIDILPAGHKFEKQAKAKLCVMFAALGIKYAGRSISDCLTGITGATGEIVVGVYKKRDGSERNNVSRWIARSEADTSNAPF